MILNGNNVVNRKDIIGGKIIHPKAHHHFCRQRQRRKKKFSIKGGKLHKKFSVSFLPPTPRVHTQRSQSQSLTKRNLIFLNSLGFKIKKNG